MRRYTVEIKKQALDDLKVLSKSEPKAWRHIVESSHHSEASLDIRNY